MDTLLQPVIFSDMSHPQLPFNLCPKCQTPSAGPVNATYTYKAQGELGTPEFDRVLSAIAYNFECAECRHKYTTCEDAR